MSVPSSSMPLSLADTRARIEAVEGWLSDDQVEVLHRAATAVDSDGRIVEIGSFRGRSTIVLAAAAWPTVEVVAIDPHAGNDRGPREIEGYEAEADADNAQFHANLAAAGVAERVRHVREFSDRAHGSVSGPIDLLYIDGAHRFGPARTDIVEWGRRVEVGGHLLIHDAFSSVGVTAAILVEMLRAPAWRYEGRVGSLAGYRRVEPDAGGRRSSTLRQIGALGWFARNVVIKALIVARLRPLTRALGHDGDTWPY